ncbi:MAG TPA: hypothetical protein PK720_04445 [bacterium]|nr:hypothetical protein [bacterium]
MLSHRIDSRDRVGVVNTNELDRLPVLASPDFKVFNQKPFNICVYASREPGYSLQEGIEFSVRWAVKNAKRRGYISGNGFSSLRGANKIGKEVGHLPVEYMPHEINGQDWNEYSGWSKGDDNLTSLTLKSPEYRGVTNTKEANEALAANYVLMTANRWHKAMNEPQNYNYFLVPLKGYLGGHAFMVIRRMTNKKGYVTQQSFGEYYGDKGKAFLEDLFSKNMFAVYFEEHLSFDTKYNYFVQKYEGQAVKAPGDENPEIYEVFNGHKRLIPDMDEFTKLFTKFHVISKPYIDRMPNL